MFSDKKYVALWGPACRRISGSSSYDGFFLVSFYACASQFYDAFFFYHKA